MKGSQITNTSPQITWHHRHATAKASFKPKKEFGTSQWSVILRTFYRQILSLLYGSFFFWNFRHRLARELLVGLILTCSNVTCICLAGVGYQPLFSCGNSFVLANINLDGQKLWHQTQHLSLTWESSLLIYQVIPTIIKYTTPTKTNILCPKLLVWFRWFSWWTMLGFIVGGFKYFVSFPRNMVKRLPRSKTSILFRLRWVARTPTYYDKHQLHLCHSVVFGCFFDTGCIGNKGDSQIPNRSMALLAFWCTCTWGRMKKHKQNDLSQLSWESRKWRDVGGGGGSLSTAASGSQGSK